jgi:hypothetical protein
MYVVELSKFSSYIGILGIIHTERHLMALYVNGESSPLIKRNIAKYYGIFETMLTNPSIKLKFEYMKTCKKRLRT